MDLARFVNWRGAPRRPVTCAAPTASPSCRILLAEDDPAMRSVVAMALRAAGHSVVEAEGGREVLELLAAGRIPDVLVIDVWMTSMRGIDALAVLRRRGLDLGVVFMTGDHADDLRNSGAIPATDIILQKPFALAELEAAVVGAYQHHGNRT